MAHVLQLLRGNLSVSQFICKLFFSDAQGCVLTCHASHGLGHLFAPLVTLARAPSRAQRPHAAAAERAAPQTVAAPSAAPPALAVHVKREEDVPGGSGGSTPGKGVGLGCSWGSGAHLLPAGGGVLTVVETRILVRACLGSWPWRPVFGVPLACCNLMPACEPVHGRTACKLFVKMTF